MDRQTLLKSMYLIAKSFDKFKAHQDEELMSMWWDVFKNEDVMLFQTAVKKLITTFEYQVPTIANLNRALAEIKNVNNVEPGDIFNEITKAIRYFGSYRTQEGYDSLSPLAQKTVDGLGGFKNLCTSETLMVDRSHALKIAQTHIERSASENLLTNSMKKEQLEARDRVLQLTEGIGNGHT